MKKYPNFNEIDQCILFQEKNPIALSKIRDDVLNQSRFLIYKRGKMSIKKDKKLELINKFKKNEKDTGSADVQVAILSEKIKSLTDHLKEHHKDFISRRGFLLW